MGQCIFIKYKNKITGGSSESLIPSKLFKYNDYTYNITKCDITYVFIYCYK